MTYPKLLRLFFAGTDTEVGKTYTAALVASHLRQQGKRVGVYKPVASGCLRRGDQLVAEDAVALWEAAGKPRTLEEVCPQRFEKPVAPPEAAAAEGKQVDAERLRSGAEPWLTDCDVLLIEGAGGLFSPLAGLASMASITGQYPKETQRKIATRMVLYIALLLTLVTWAGQALLQLLGVTTAQLTAAGGLALMLAAVPMMTGKVEKENGELIDSWLSKKSI